MANYQSFKLPKRIANVCFKLQKASKHLHQASSSIGFIEKCMQNHIIPKFATVNGQFTSPAEKSQVERQVMASHRLKHIEKANQASLQSCNLKNELTSQCGPVLGRLLINKAENALISEITKNQEQQDLEDVD